MDVLAGIPAATLGHEVTMGMESMASAAEAEIKMEPSLRWHRATTGLDHQPEEDLSMKEETHCVGVMTGWERVGEELSRFQPNAIPN